MIRNTITLATAVGAALILSGLFHRHTRPGARNDSRNLTLRLIGTRRLRPPGRGVRLRT